VTLHQASKIFRLLIAELEHNLDLAIGEHAHIRGIFFRKEPVQTLTLLENSFTVGSLLLGKLLTSFNFLLVFGRERNYLILRRESPAVLATPCR
jgi:hypothetical protein